MSLLPVVTPRTSDALQHQRLVHQVQSDQVGLQRLYDQMSTGRRVIDPADDPAAAARALGFRQGIDYSEQLIRNANAASGYLRSVDTALASIDDSLIEARGVAVSAAQNVVTGSERQAMLAELDQLIERLVMVGNQSFRDHSLLGGALTNTPPLQWQDGNILFSGNEAAARATIGPGTSVETLPNGTSALGLASPSIRGDELSAGLASHTRLLDARDGRGITPGILRLSDGGGWTEVDLRGAVTIGDIADQLSAVQLGGRQLAVDISADSLTLRYADGLNGTLAVSDVPGGELAKQMQIANPQGTTAPPLVGEGLAPRTTTATRLSDLNGGAGVDVSSGIRIQQGEQTFDVDLSGAETVQEVLQVINRSGAAVRAELEPTSGRIQLRLLMSGVSYSVGELGGGSAATALGLRSADGATRLDSLRNGRGAGLSGDERADLSVLWPDGSILEINADGLTTVDDVLAAINDHPDNQDAQRVTAALASNGNGIELRGPSGSGPIEVSQASTSQLGTALGLIPAGQNSQSGSSEAGDEVLRGTDYAAVEAGGALDTLLRMRTAVADGNSPEIERLAARLEQDFDRASRLRSTVGYRSQAVERMRGRAEDEAVLMKSRMSDEIDADYTSVVSEISRRQASLEASLRLIGQTAGLTVLNFL